MTEYYGNRLSNVVYGRNEYSYLYKKVDDKYYYLSTGIDDDDFGFWVGHDDTEWVWKERIGAIENYETFHLLDINKFYIFTEDEDNEEWVKICMMESKLGKQIL